MNVRRMLVLLTFALGVAALGASSSAHGATLGGTWVSTSTQALNLNGQLLGSAPADEQLEISAVLPLRNSSSKKKRATRSQCAGSENLCSSTKVYVFSQSRSWAP